MDSEMIVNILKAYDELVECLPELDSAIKNDKLPIWLPPSYATNINDDEKRSLASRSLTAIWNDDLAEVFPPSGLICCSKETILITNKVNAAKERFEKAVIKLRDSKKPNNSNKKPKNIGDAVNNAIRKSRNRDKHIKEGLKTARISRLNLTACYKRIKIVENNLRSISWTWARNHKQIEPITYINAVKEAALLENPSAEAIATKLLSSISPSTKLAQVKYKKNPQLRANITYRENGDLLKTQAVTSNIILTSDVDLPILKWANENANLRLSRSDVLIMPEPFIKALNLHLYETELSK